ncbi:MAG: hypothetical protein KJ914_13220 [Gammaproteobacteria bacterium]|nr:hypothetical protein [Gammaproteobacteria bacterium]MBU1725397.1 hypothetical protein [Gammaproteobacteria bacterium]MBU2005267.1 hypothetical protein [Gammaproteobacteria bacterium]
MEYVLLGALFLGILLFVIGWLVVVVSGFQRHPVTGLFALIPGLNLITLPSLWHRVSGWVITGFVGLLLATGAWFSGADSYLYTQAKSLGMHVTSPAAEPDAGATPEASQQRATHTIDIPLEARAKPAAATAPAPSAAPAPAAATPAPVVTEPLALPPANAKPAEQSVPVQQAATPTEAPLAAPTPTTPATPLAPDQDLPASALYHIVFKSIAVNELASASGQYVRIVQKDGQRREGKVQTSSANEILLEERMDGGSVTRTIKLEDIREASAMSREKGGE